LTEFVSFWSTSIRTSSNSTVAFTIFTSSEVIGVSITSVVLVGFTFLSLGVIEVSVGRSRSTSDALVGRKRTSVSLGRTATPDVSVEVAFIVDRADVSCSRVGADVVISLVILVSITLRALRFRDNVFTSVLAFKESFKVVVVSLTSSVIEDFTSTSYSIVPVSSDTLLTVSESQRLRTDGLWTRTADIVVRLTFVSAGAIRVGGTTLVVGSNLQRSTIIALKLSTEKFTFS